MGSGYFNPRTPCGVRHNSHHNLQDHRNFNPRTPCGVRLPTQRKKTGKKLFQSTHPLRGATHLHRSHPYHASNVNPRTPCGVRQEFPHHPYQSYEFQSTHPLRGATERQITKNRFIKFQSTHPLRGATRHFAPPVSNGKIFQSTHPLRGATDVRLDLLQVVDISIHAPLAGCDPTPDWKITRQYISIHAPLAGCDAAYFRWFLRAGDFNPRTPCGVRPFGAPDKNRHFAFQSTHPLRGATCCATQ